MNESNKTPLVIAFVVVVILFLVFGYGLIGGSLINSEMMRHEGWRGGQGWMWVPTMLTLAFSVLLGWMIFGKHK